MLAKPRYRVKAIHRPMLSVVPYNKNVDPRIVEGVAQFFERAEAGEFVSVAMAAICRDGSMTTSYATNGRGIALMGAVHQLQRRVSSIFSTE